MTAIVTGGKKGPQIWKQAKGCKVSLQSSRGCCSSSICLSEHLTFKVSVPLSSYLSTFGNS